MLDILIKEYDYKTIDIKLLYDSKCNDIFLEEYNRYPDNIIVLKGGSLVEEGTHNELRMKKGLYFQLSELQQKGFANF